MEEALPEVVDDIDTGVTQALAIHEEMTQAITNQCQFIPVPELKRAEIQIEQMKELKKDISEELQPVAKILNFVRGKIVANIRSEK